MGMDKGGSRGRVHVHQGMDPPTYCKKRQEAARSRTGSPTDVVTEARTGSLGAGCCTGAGCSTVIARRFGSGTVMATSSPSTSAATAMTAIPGPELVCDSNSMASVEKITVHEP
jgi:hypothetical protein